MTEMKHSCSSGVTENYLELDEIMADGYGIVSRKVMRASFISNNAKSLYSYLCSFAGNGNTAFPSTETIKRELNMCKDTFYSARKELTSYGLIDVITESTRKGRRTIYHLCSDAKVTQDAQQTHAKTEAIRASKAAKATMMRSSSPKKDPNGKASSKANAQVSKQEAINVPRGFRELERISLKKIKADEYTETVQAYVEAVSSGYDPDDILRGYERYIERYKQEHPFTVRYAKQLRAYLTQPDGLTFDIRRKKPSVLMAQKSPEVLERERMERALQMARENLMSSDPEYQQLVKSHSSCITKARHSLGNTEEIKRCQSELAEIESKMQAKLEERVKLFVKGKPDER